jgi:hypothetical protein
MAFMARLRTIRIAAHRIYAAAAACAAEVTVRDGGFGGAAPIAATETAVC